MAGRRADQPTPTRSKAARESALKAAPQKEDRTTLPPPPAALAGFIDAMAEVVLRRALARVERARAVHNEQETQE